MGIQDIQARDDASGEDAGGTPAMDIGDGWQAHEDRGELLAEIARLRGAIVTANNALVDVCHGDHEHQIECHADTLPKEHRRVATAAQAALDALSPIVWEMVDPEARPDDDATAPEPPPLATGSQPIWPLVIADAEALGCSRLIPDMKARDAFGRAKYGTPLTADNGRNHLADAYQEALDEVVYLRAAMANGADAGLLYAEAMRVALRIRDAIDGRDDPADTAARELGEMPDAEFAERVARAKKALGKG